MKRMIVCLCVVLAGCASADATQISKGEFEINGLYKKGIILMDMAPHAMSATAIQKCPTGYDKKSDQLKKVGDDLYMIWRIKCH